MYAPTCLYFVAASLDMKFHKGARDSHWSEAFPSAYASTGKLILRKGSAAMLVHSQVAPGTTLYP